MGHTIKKRDLGLVDCDVKSSVGKSGRDLDLLLERLVISLLHRDDRLVVVMFLVVEEFRQQEGLGYVVVHQDLCQYLSTEGGEEIPLEALWKFGKREIVRSEVGSQAETSEVRVIRLGLFVVVLPFVIVFSSKFLDCRGESREYLGEEVVFVK